MANRQNSSGSPIAGIIALLFMAMIAWLAIKAVTGVFSILAMLAIPLFVLALILNYRVVPEYFNWVISKIRQDTVKGLLIAGGSIVGYPLVSAWLALKAYTTRKKIKKQKGNPKKGEYVKYEEVEEVEEEDFLELDDLDKVKQKEKSTQSRTNDYDNLFE